MLIRNSAIYLVARVGPSLLGLAGIAIYTRLLDPDGYGVFALIFSGAGLAQVWLFEWLRLACLRYLPRYPKRRVALSSALTSAALAMVLALLVLSAVLASVGLAPPEQIGVGAALALSIGLFGLASALALADLKPVRFMWMRFVQAVLLPAVGIPALLLDLGPLALAGALALATLVAAWLQVIPELRRIDLRETRRLILRRFWRYGLPLSLASGFGVVVLSSDRFMIAWLLDTGAAGSYAATYWIAAHPISALLTVVSQAAIPLAVTAYERDGEDAARSQLKNNLTLLAGIGVPATVGIALVSEELASVLLGTEFRTAAVPLAPWIALATLVHGFVAYHFSVAFQLAQRTLPMAATSLAAAVLNFSLNLVLIPSLGLIGAAVASLAAHALALTISSIWGRSIFRLPRPSGDVLTVGLAAAVMAAVLWFLQLEGLNPALRLAFRVAAGGLVYLVLIYALDVGGMRKVVARRFATRRGRRSAARSSIATSTSTSTTPDAGQLTP